MKSSKPLPPNLKLKARVNRKKSTKAEDMLWQELRNRQLNGYKFRRQHPIQEKGQMILDFFCQEKMLAVEVDGGYHDNPAQQELDAARTNMLTELGISVIRFTNEEVVNSLPEVLSKLLSWLEEPSPQPFPGGRGSR